MKIINRVKKYREFKEIINLRRFKRNELYTVYFRKNDFGYARIGILVSKKNGIAVQRVKIKRQVRAILDKNIDYKNNALDIIVIISKKYKTDEFGKNEELLGSLIKQILSVKETKINEQKKS